MSTNYYLSLLKKKGYRITTVRKAIAAIFERHQEPLSADEIKELLKEKKLFPNKTTIYRELETLLKETIVEVVDLGEGKKRYELSGKGHHHHLFCQQCQKITCVEIGSHLAEVEKSIEQSLGFVVLGHHLEFIGLCKNCH